MVDYPRETPVDRRRLAQDHKAVPRGYQDRHGLFRILGTNGNRVAVPCVMYDRLPRHSAVGEFEEIGELLQRSKAQTSQVQAEIKSVLDELRSIKGQEYQQLRRGRFSMPQNHVL